MTLYFNYDPRPLITIPDNDVNATFVIQPTPLPASYAALHISQYILHRILKSNIYFFTAATLIIYFFGNFCRNKMFYTRIFDPHTARPFRILNLSLKRADLSRRDYFI